MDKEKLLHIVVDSLPETSMTWVDALSAFLTPTIALIAIYIAFQQHRINKQRLRHETYERRLNIYKVVQKHLSIILREGKMTYQGCAEFYAEASEAAFLFDKSVQDKIDNMYRKSSDVVALYEKMYPSDSSPGLPVGEERSKVALEHSELLKWYHHQLSDSKEFFAKKLGLKHT